MRFRIVTNGQKFRIQRKGWLRWRWVGQWHSGYDGGGYLQPFDYPSDAEAVKFIKWKFGEGADIERPWYPSQSVQGPV